MMKENLWKPYMKIYKNGSKHFEEHGNYLAREERGKIQEMVIEVIRSILLPWAERRFKTLVASIAPKRTIFFFINEDTSSKEDIEKVNWELRFAADFALLLQDYNNAAIHYKRLFERISKGNRYSEIGSSKEFHAISSFIINGSKKDFLKSMELALQYYEKGNNYSLIIRNSIYAFDILMLSGLTIDAADYLAKALQYVAKEIDAPGLFLEKAGFTLLKSSHIFIRKFVQYLVSAGTYYEKQGLVRNAIYCLEAGYAIFKQTNWPEALIYICEQLGCAYNKIGKLEQSFVFYKKVIEIAVECKSTRLQESEFKSFIKVAEKLKDKHTKPPEEQTNDDTIENTKKARLKAILQMNNLITMSSQSFEFLLAQDQIYCNDKQRLFRQAYDLPLKYIIKEPSVDQFTEITYNRTQGWMTLGKLMDGDLSDPIENSQVEWQSRRERSLRDLVFYDTKQTEQKAILYAKKKRFVHVNETIYVKFFCKNPLSVPLEITEMKIACHYLEGNTEEDLDSRKISLSLKGNEEYETVLQVTPKKEGELCIDGIEWIISNVVSGLFTMKQVTNKAEPIILDVKEKAGQLEVIIDKDLRISYFNGEVDSYTLKLKNTGDLPVTNVLLRTDYPLLLGWKTLSFDWSLNKGEEKEIKIFIHARFIRPIKGKEALLPRILIRYNTSGKETYHRYKRIEHSFTVNNSFVIVSKTIRSQKDLNKYLLNLQIEQLQMPNTHLQLTQLCVVNNDYKIKETKQFTGFGKVFNSFIELIRTEQDVPLEERKIVYQDKDSLNKDITLNEPYVNYIKEFKDYRVNEYNKRRVIATIVDILAVWTLRQEQSEYKGCTLILIYLNYYHTQKNAITKEPSKVDIFPLQVAHKCLNIVNHNFTTNPICKIKLLLTIKNSIQQPISFQFEALKVQNEGNATHFIWQGQTVKNIIGLKYEEERKIKLEVCVARPGIYDFNRFLFKFFRDPNTGEDFDPSMDIPRNAKMKVFTLEMEQIIVTVLSTSN